MTQETVLDRPGDKPENLFDAKGDNSELQIAIAHLKARLDNSEHIPEAKRGELEVTLAAARRERDGVTDEVPHDEIKFADEDHLLEPGGISYSLPGGTSNSSHSPETSFEPTQYMDGVADEEAFNKFANGE